jgi:hypothetical protein
MVACRWARIIFSNLLASDRLWSILFKRASNANGGVRQQEESALKLLDYSPAGKSRSRNNANRGMNGRQFRRSRRRDLSRLNVSELCAAQASASRKLKRELQAHLSFKMYWKIIYGTKLMEYLITQKSPLNHGATSAASKD